MIGPFPRRIHIRMVSIEPESHAAVLQCETSARRNDAAAESVADGVNEGAGVTLSVRDGEVDGIADVVGGGSVVDVCGGFDGIEQLCAPCKVGLR